MKQLSIFISMALLVLLFTQCQVVPPKERDNNNAVGLWIGSAFLGDEQHDWFLGFDFKQMDSKSRFAWTIHSGFHLGAFNLGDLSGASIGAGAHFLSNGVLMYGGGGGRNEIFQGYAGPDIDFSYLSSKGKPYRFGAKPGVTLGLLFPFSTSKDFPESDLSLEGTMYGSFNMKEKAFKEDGSTARILYHLYLF